MVNFIKCYHRLIVDVSLSNDVPCETLLTISPIFSRPPFIPLVGVDAFALSEEFLKAFLCFSKVIKRFRLMLFTHQLQNMEIPAFFQS